MFQDYYDGAEFRAGGNVTHQQETRFKDQDQLPQKAESTLKLLDRELAVDEEYKEAFEIANRLLKFYQDETKISNGEFFAAAALYFGFRCKNAPYLLIELSEKVKDDSATKVAKCYLKLLKFVKGDARDSRIEQLAQSLQYLDPSIYIPKFVRALDFGEKHKQIVNTALKLIKRMMLDWMAYGRRPSSLCGAALLISARFHGENISTSQVCKTVQVCDETIRKRLAEFNQTGLSQLTREQFEQIENIETGIPGPVNDPPAFKKIKQQEEEQKKGLTDQEIKQLEEKTLQKALEMIELLKAQPEIYNQENNLILDEVNENKKGKICEELSSLSEDEENEYILTEADKAYKQVVWQSLYKDYMHDRKLKNDKKLQQQQKNQLMENKQSNKKKKIKVKQEQACQTPYESVLKKFENDNINPQALEKLFEKQEIKKEETLQDLLSEFKK